LPSRAVVEPSYHVDQFSGVRSGPPLTSTPWSRAPPCTWHRPSTSPTEAKYSPKEFSPMVSSVWLCWYQPAWWRARACRVWWTAIQRLSLKMPQASRVASSIHVTFWAPRRTGWPPGITGGSR